MVGADRIVVPGGGFTGTLLAVKLLRNAGRRVTLVKRRADVARGGADRTDQPSHLLNVRAANIGPLPDPPGYFARRLKAHGEPPNSVALRQRYGTYPIAPTRCAAASMSPPKRRRSAATGDGTPGRWCSDR